MSQEGPEALPPRRLLRRWLRIAAVLLTAAAGFAVLVHTPPFRRAVLRYAIATVERQYGVKIEAARLDYNLPALRVGLADLRLFAAAADVPFFEARYVTASLRRTVLAGDMAFRTIAVTDGRVRVVRRADGTTNLPSSTSRAGVEPPPLRIDDLLIPRLAFELRDAATDIDVDVPAIELRLSARGGRVALQQIARVRVADRTTRVSRAAGEATFDGRRLTLDNLRVESDETSLRADGGLTLITERPSMELLVIGSADLSRLAGWALSDPDLPAGRVVYQAHASGPLDDPGVDLRLRMATVSWKGLAATDLTATARLDSIQLQLGHFEATVDGGRVGGAAAIPLDASKNGGTKIAWDGIDAARFVSRLTKAPPIVPAGTLAGDLEIQGPLATPEQWTATGTVRVGPARARPGQLAMPGEATWRLARARWSLSARHRLGGAVPMTLALAGRLAPSDIGQSTMEGTLQIAPSDLPLVLRVLRGSGLLNVPPEQVPSGTVEASVRIAGRITSPTLDATGRLNNIAGPRFSAASVDLTAAGTPDRLAIAVSARGGLIAGQVLSLESRGRFANGRLEIDEVTATQRDVPGAMTATGSFAVRSREFSASVRVAGWQLSPTAELPVSGRIDAQFAGAGSMEQPRGEGRVRLTGGVWREVDVGTIDARVRLDGEAAEIDGEIPMFDTRAHARVGLTSPSVAAIDVRTDNLDLVRVLAHVETPTPIAGRMSMRARGEGPLDDWRRGRATLTVGSLDATAGELSIRLLEPASLSYADRRVRIDRLEAAAGATTISGAGALPVDASAPGGPDDALLFTVLGDVGEVLRASRALGVPAPLVTSGHGPFTLLARVTATLDAPALAGDLEVGPGGVVLDRLQPVSDLRVRAHLEHNWLELREAAASYQGARLTATGRGPISLFWSGAPPTTGGALSVHARATGLSPAALEGIIDAATREQLAGAVDVSVDLDAASIDVDAFTGELRLDRFDVRVADLPVTQKVPTRIAIGGGFARVAAWDWTGQGANLGVRGQIALRSRQAAILADGSIDLRTITPFVRDAGMTTGGRMVPRLSITGAIDDPRIDGDITIDQGQIRVVEPRVIASDLAARVILSRTSATITTLTGTVNGGALTGGGRVDYIGGSQIDAALTADLRNVALEYPQGFRSELNAGLQLDVTADGSEGAAGRLTGTVNMLRGAYREPMAMVTGLLAGLRSRRLASATSPSFLDRLAVDLRLLTDEDIIVDNNYGRVRLGGDLRVLGTAAAPVLSGRAELREGGQLFVGRNVYSITSGTIDFANAVTIDPELNVEATTRAGGTEIVVRLTGTPATLTPELSSPSNPELGQADLTSLLLTGRELDELAPDDAAFIGAQVVGNLSGEVLGFAGRAIGLDSLRLGGVGDASRRDPTAIATEVDPTTRLTFNKSLRSDVEITYSQSLRDAAAQTWIVDYLPSRQLQLRLVSDDEDLRSYGFRHDVAFGGAPRAVRSEQTATTPPRVSEVVFEGELGFPESRLRALLRLKPGDVVDFAEWQADRDRLEQFYRRQQRLRARITTAKADDDGGAVRLTYTVAAGPETRVSIAGSDLGPGVIARIERAWADSVFDQFLIDEVSEIVTAALAAEGYLQAKVTARLAMDGEAERLDVSIDPGNRVTHIEVRLEISEPALKDDAIRWLEDRRLVDAAATNPGLVQRELTGYLRSRGYLGARVTVGSPLFEAQTATIPVAADTGRASVLGRVAFEGADGWSIPVLAGTLDLAEGVPYDPATVQSARDRLVALFRREGFVSPTVDVREAPRGDAIDLIFAISPGARQFVDDVTIAGNRSIDEDVIARNVAVRVGEPLRTDDLLRARRRLFETGLFRRVDVTTEPLNVAAAGGAARTPPDGLPTRVRVAVEEWPALRVRYGFRVNEERSAADAGRRDLAPGFSGDLTRRTLFGRAVTLGGAAEYQHRERRGRLFVTMPTLMGLPIASSLVGEGSRTDFADSNLVTARRGVSWEQRTRIAGNMTLSYAYRFDRDHTFDTKPDPSFPAFDVTVNIARLTGAFARDTRDDPSDTVTGSLLTSTLEYAPEALGSDIRFVRYVAQAYAFRPWRRVVLASAGRVGVVAPLGGQELIPSERFFAGGSRTVRGLEEEGLGGRDFFGSPIGGRALLVLNQEVRVPIYRWLRGVGFVDAGNVFPSAAGIRLSDLVGSAGLGARLNTPIGILRADYGRQLWPTPAASSGRWSFGLGHIF